MNFLEITATDIKKIFKNRFIGISVIAIIITPLFYSFFYLSSFWDPYGNLQNMPVAVVNLDKGTINDNNSVNYGRGLVDELKTNNDVGWRFVSQSDADKGLTGNKYYGEIIIPGDFSEKALSAKDGTPRKPNIVFKDNPKKNYIATKIYSSVKNNLEDKITKSLVKEYTKVTFDNLYNVKDGMNQAVDGSNKLTSGVSSLKDGSLKLTNGMLSVIDGSNQLKSGLASANSGSNQLKDGLGQLSNQVPQLQSGVSSLFNGSNELVNSIGINSQNSLGLIGGINNLTSGISSEKNGISILNYGLGSELAGINRVGGAMATLNTRVNVDQNGQPSLVSGAKQVGLAIGNLNTKINVDQNGQLSLVNGVKQIGSSLEDLNKLSNGLSEESNRLQLLLNQYSASTDSNAKEQLIQEMNGIITSISTLNSGVGSLNNAVNGENGLVDGITNSDPQKGVGAAVGVINNAVNGENGLVDGITNSDPQKGVGAAIKTLNTAVNDGTNENLSLTAGMQKLKDNTTNKIMPGMNQLYDGGNNLIVGANKLGNGLLQLNNGLNDLNSSTPELVSGVNQLYNGASSLSDGTNQLYNGASSLGDGTDQLYNGANNLSDGTNKIYNGSKELSDKLSNGARNINKNLKNSSTAMGDFVAQPINVETKHLFADETYGIALAPYFIPISIWVGALLMFFVVSDEVDKDIKVKAKSIVFGKYLVYIGIGSLQAVCVSTAVLFIGIRPSNLFVFYLFNIFISFVFIAIMQCLIFLLKDVGRLLGIILLVLQLASSAGTFPIELSPKFYRVISPFMPFTYVVSGLREVINGINYSILGKDISFLMLVFVIFFTLSLTFRGKVIKFHEIIEEKKNESAA